MDILLILRKHGAILTDEHFVYKSGKHGPHYINMDPVLPDVSLMDRISKALLCDFEAWGRDRLVDTVASAATGAIPLAYLTARHIHEASTSAVWADKVGDDFIFERAGFVEQLKDKRVLVVEDLLNTGDTVKKVIAQVRKHGGEVVGVSVVCNRGSETAESLGVCWLKSLAQVDFQTFDADSCPFCAEGRPIVEDIGHGHEYKKAHPHYAGGYATLLS